MDNEQMYASLISHPGLEATIARLDASPSQENMWQLVRELRREMQQKKRFLIPLLPQTLDELMHVDKLDLESVDAPAASLFQMVELEKGGLAWCAFTSQEELEKGSDCPSEQMEIKTLFDAAWTTDAIMGIVINPWGLSVLIDRAILALIFDEEDEYQEQSSLYIDRGETCQQQADVVVSCAAHPFSFQEEGPRAMLEESHGELENAVELLPSLRPGQIVCSPAPGLKAEAVYHAALPDPLCERSLSSLIYSLLDRAAQDGMQSIAIPAIGTEEGDLDEPLPFAVIAAAGWLSAHPEIRLDVTITCRRRQTYDLFYEYLFQ